MTLIVKKLIITSQVFEDPRQQEPLDKEQFKRELLRACERMIRKKIKQP
jgi:hypothetical protein